jgi:hypothetical protein
MSSNSKTNEIINEINDYINKIPENNKNLYCNCCQFHCSKKTSFDAHLKTQKHIKMMKKYESENTIQPIEPIEPTQNENVTENVVLPQQSENKTENVVRTNQMDSELQESSQFEDYDDLIEFPDSKCEFIYRLILQNVGLISQNKELKRLLVALDAQNDDFRKEISDFKLKFNS